MITTVYIPEPLLAEVKAAAALDHRSVSSFVRLAVSQKLNPGEVHHVHEKDLGQSAKNQN